MPLFLAERWASALHRLRLALEGENTAIRILAESQERIGRARDALERRATEPRCRLRSRPQVSAGAGLEPHGDSTLVFGHDGVVILHGLPANGDDEAAALARTILGRVFAELWDGTRFVEQFEAPATEPARSS